EGFQFFAQPSELFRPGLFLVSVCRLEKNNAGGLLVGHLAPVKRLANGLLDRIFLLVQLMEDFLGIFRVHRELNRDLVIASNQKGSGVGAASTYAEAVPMVSRRFLRTQ